VHALHNRLRLPLARLGSADQMIVQPSPSGMVAPDHIVLHPELRRHYFSPFTCVFVLYVVIVLFITIEFLFISYRRKP
jgi:hypothetical protein